MIQLSFSFIIPVFNRPEEVDELLQSFVNLKGNHDFEIVIVEDGSTNKSDEVISSFCNKLNISYYFKENTGPGDSRNFGMKKARGNYFIILDSDCLLPPNYLNEVKTYLETRYVDFYGGPDASHHSFSNIQKAIDFSMTSFISTGGIRGGENFKQNFQPRSFNMGISKIAFTASKGFGDIHPGEDPDLSIRLKKMGFKSALFPNAFVFHKRRISLSKFYNQVTKFGLVRPILNKWHPETKKLIFWLPSLFIIGLIISVTLVAFNLFIPIYVFAIYFLIAFTMALFKYGNINIAILSIIAIFIQFYGYGNGFLKSFFHIGILKQNPRLRFPKLFFKNVQAT